MIAMLQFSPIVVLVMTSNLPCGDLDAIDRTHGGGLLRDGRVTHRFTMGGDAADDDTIMTMMTSDDRKQR